MSLRCHTIWFLLLGLASTTLPNRVARAALPPLASMSELARVALPRAAAEVARIRTAAEHAPPAPGRQAGIARALRLVGPGGRAALAELVVAQSAVIAASRPAERARQALVAGALEALAQKPDQPAVDLALSVLASTEGARPVLGAAALVLGRRAGRADVEHLIVLATRPIDDSHAGLVSASAMVALGHARVPEAMRYLAGRIAANDPALAELAEAAAFSGSSWAWEALGPARADEGRALRSELVAALLAAWPAAAPAQRPAVERALEVIDAGLAEARLSTVVLGEPQRVKRDALLARLRRAQRRGAL